MSILKKKKKNRERENGKSFLHQVLLKVKIGISFEKRIIINKYTYKTLQL